MLSATSIKMSLTGFWVSGCKVCRQISLSLLLAGCILLTMKTLLLSCILLFVFAFTNAQSKPLTLLWKVTKDNSPYVSYLFGTFHEVNPSFFLTLTNAVDQLHASDKLFVEQRSTNASFVQTDAWSATRWNSMLTTAQKQVFTSFVNKAEDSSYYSMNPLVLALNTARLYFSNFCNNDDSISGLMDTYIEKLAVKENKKVYSLDSNQHALINQLAAKEDSAKNAALIAGGIGYMHNMLTDDVNDCKYIEAYKHFDIDYKLDTTLTEKSADYSLLVNRNSQWLTTLDKAFASANCFVAVGFKHLMYQQGLIQQLKALGYTVIPVASKL